MRIGYPCKNIRLEAGTRTFRLASYTEERMRETVAANLVDLERILAYNAEFNLLHFRVSSGIIPFASHRICTFDWRGEFEEPLARIAKYTQKHGIRLSVHPGQFVLINSPTEEIVARSFAELAYQTELLDALGAGPDGKVQIHVGGVYGDKPVAMERFVTSWQRLPDQIKRRLAIENDERMYCLADCLAINKLVQIPVIFDIFHHSIYNSGEMVGDAVMAASKTWQVDDGPPMLDYSNQSPTKQVGAHSEHITSEDFRSFLESMRGLNADIMLEVKDKESSALEALAIAKQLGIAQS